MVGGGSLKGSDDTTTGVAEPTDDDQESARLLASSLCIFALSLGGAGVNVAAVCILARKRLSTVFHNLLKVLACYDLVSNTILPR